MVYTFKNLRDQVLRMVDEIGETTTEELVKELMNQAHQIRCTERKWNFMLHPREVSFTTVANQRTYTLHQEFGRPMYFYSVTNDTYLMEIPKEQIDENPDSLKSSAASQALKQFAFIGETPFKAQPTNAGTVSVVSTSVSDSGAGYEVVVKGENTNGEVFAEILTLNGTTPVVTTGSFAFLISLTKSQSFNGTITVTCDSTAVLTLLPWEMGRTYRQVYFLENPTGGEVINYRFYHQPLVLVNDYDVPDIPGPYSQVLVWDTLLLLSTYLTGIDPGKVELWKNMSMSWELNLHSHEMGGQTVGSRPAFFKDLRGE